MVTDQLMGNASSIAFRVTGWAAWAPGLETAEDWQAWARQPFAPTGEAMPALEKVPAMQRRRIDRLGRAAIQALGGCRLAEDAGQPLVFVSRHGDVGRSYALLEALGAQQSMSPTQFGLSVHNAIAALYSIVRGERGNYTALAGGCASVETALVEAVGLLADGAASVSLVVCDSQAPQAYTSFLDEPDAFFGFAWRLVADDAGAAAEALGERLSLHWDDASTLPDQAADADTLPNALAAHHFLLSGASRRREQAEGVQWCWKRHA